MELRTNERDSELWNAHGVTGNAQMFKNAPRVGLALVIGLQAQVSIKAQVSPPPVVTTTSALPVPSPVSPKLQSDLSTIQSENQASRDRLVSMLASGASLDQLTSFQLQTRNQVGDITKLASVIFTESPAATLPVITDVSVPTGASQELISLQLAKANFLNGLATNGRIAQLSDPVLTFSNKTALEQATALQSASQTIAPVASSSPPPGASDKIAAFMHLRDDLMRAELQVYYLYRNADPASRDAALNQFRQANASQFAAVRDAMKNL